MFLIQFVSLRVHVCVCVGLRILLKACVLAVTAHVRLVIIFERVRYATCVDRIRM